MCVADLVQVYLSLIRPVLEYGHVLLVGCNEELSASMERYLFKICSPEANTSLSWFDFYDGKAITGYNDEGIYGINVEECARRCLVGTSTVPSGSCMSFEYDNRQGRCILSTSTKDTPGAVLSDSNPSSRYDYYHRRNAPYGPCDFETDLCQFTQDTADDFDWTRHSGGTPSGNTGPTVDHTTGTSSGYYMYIETSGPQDGDAARLISPSYRPYTDGQCLLFWAHMYGGYVGTLTVSVKAGGTTTVIWSRSRNQGNQWFSVAVNIPTTGSYQVIFEGVKGELAHGDIAIDDVSILQGGCPDVDECVPSGGKGPCDYACSNTVGGFVCSCDAGYVLQQDGLTCADVDECNGGRGPCDHTCSNTDGSYICTCNSGYRLNSDGHACDRKNNYLGIMDLEPYTYYQFWIVAKIGDFQSNRSEIVNRRTQAGVPAVPQNVRLTNLSWSELRVTWNDPENFYGPNRGHVISLYTSTSSDVVKNGIEVAHNSSEHNFSGLEAATSYTVEVRANNGKNTGPPGNATARTSDGFQSPPTNIRRQEEDTHCNISWSSPVVPRGDIIGYKVHLQGDYLDKNGQAQRGEYNVKSTTFTSIRLMKSSKTEILDLLPNSVYTINVTGFTYTGEGDFSQTVNCTVPPGKPSKPESPVPPSDPKDVSTTFPLQVKPASDRNGPIGCYHIVVVKSNIPVNLPYPEMLQPYKTLEEAKNSVDGNIAYIAMALTPDAVGESTELTIGDGTVTSCKPQQGGRKRRALTSDDVYNQEYTNSPLELDSSYTTSVRAYGPNDGEQPYFSASQYMEPVSTGLIGLGAVSALLLVALVASVAAVVVLKRRLASEKSKRESNGTTVRNDAFDDTYYTDTRTNRANDDGTYIDVISDDSTERGGTNQDGEYDMPDVGGEEGAYQTLDPRTLEQENNEYQKFAKKRVLKHL
ncbi:MDGA1 [Branchiostoma lanceolatum]|uniref:MDGA1 protein n=1 Tax=Branchiostoma lanceolatum TaxID=7740 RepID=A0A8J9YXS7_BRALA|nr:MDGA1 [Branchiostoma lanceolatum]